MKTEKLNITYTWVQALPVYLLGITNANKEGRDIAMTELKRMAELADKYDALIMERLKK